MFANNPRKTLMVLQKNKNKRTKMNVTFKLTPKNLGLRFGFVLTDALLSLTVYWTKQS